MEKIKRKSMLYKTEVEYGDYTLNHVQGCSHGCKYPCYAYMMAKRFGRARTYEEWTSPKIAYNTLEILEKEIPKLKNKIESVQLCFTTDPFMCGYHEVKDMSLKIIKLLNDNNIKCVVLTKGILPQELSLLSKDNEYGITLVSLSEYFREQQEPGASKLIERINALKYLHDNGFKTWISMEPYPTPNIINQNIYEILEKISFVDKIIFGRTNYSKVVSNYKKHKEFYNEMAYNVIDYCKKNNIEYYIKKGTVTD